MHVHRQPCIAIECLPKLPFFRPDENCISPVMLAEVGSELVLTPLQQNQGSLK